MSRFKHGTSITQLPGELPGEVGWRGRLLLHRIPTGWRQITRGHSGGRRRSGEDSELRNPHTQVACGNIAVPVGADTRTYTIYWLIWCEYCHCSRGSRRSTLLFTGN
ncbi:hypothetical protein J6590_029897 [Homalodisca vitripennis]|nr:hypothetical protein J6590_099514 [Homalodisca vitripennis]KAG8317324.1 hypothetical protein J6590_029897 [Homalodisca vitripennis]